MTGAAVLSIRVDILSTSIAFHGFRFCSLDNTKRSFIRLNLNSSVCCLQEPHSCQKTSKAKSVAAVEKYRFRQSE